MPPAVPGRRGVPTAVGITCQPCSREAGGGGRERDLTGWYNWPEASLAVKEMDAKRGRERTYMFSKENVLRKGRRKSVSFFCTWEY